MQGCGPMAVECPVEYLIQINNSYEIEAAFPDKLKLKDEFEGP
jgi:hypothetical protein